MNDEIANKDSQEGVGGWIPDTHGVPAYRVEEWHPSVIPVMIAVPHAGRVYPQSLVDKMRRPEVATLKLEDRYIDSVARAVARETGANLLIAHAPRAMIDLNRSLSDIDWDMFDKEARPNATEMRASYRALGGLGLIPRRLPSVGELWRGIFSGQQLKERIEGVHGPYHERLSAMLVDLQARWGAALLIDLHSMPPLTAGPIQTAPEFVIGDRFGASCDGRLVYMAISQISGAGRPVAHNRPYSGGYVLERHACPSAGVHAMQIEVDRSCYLDASMVEPAAGMGDVVAVLSRMIRTLASEVASMAGDRLVKGVRRLAE